MLKRQRGVVFTAIKGPNSLILAFFFLERRKISFSAMALHTVCFAIEYGNMLMCRLLLSPHCPLLESRGGPRTEAWGGSRRGRRWGSLEGNSFLLPKCHKGLDTDLKSDVHLPPIPLHDPPPHGFIFLFALSLYRPSLLFHPPSNPFDPLYPRPAAFFVQPISLNWYQHRGDGCCVSQLGEMRWWLRTMESHSSAFPLAGPPLY